MDEEKLKRMLEQAKARRAPSEASSPVQRRDGPDDLVLKTKENALVEPAEATRQPGAATRASNDAAWEAWLSRRLDERFVDYTEGCNEFVQELIGEAVATLRSEQQLSAQERDLKLEARFNNQFLRLWTLLEQATKTITELRTEKIERALHSELDPKAMN